jgi:hypothetical protein
MDPGRAGYYCAMGLDHVELVMEVEDRFGITLPDAECERVRTVADLAALVVSRLPRPDGVCPTARTFFQFRTLAMVHGGIQRRRLRPAVRLDELFPPGPRRLWRTLRRHDHRLPRLAMNHGAQHALFIGAALLWLAWVGGLAVALTGRANMMAMAIIFVLLGLVTLAMVLLDRRAPRYFPPELQTVGDLARRMAPIHVPHETPGERLIAQQRVLAEVRRIIACQMALPVEKVLPETDFVKDLS